MAVQLFRMLFSVLFAIVNLSPEAVAKGFICKEVFESSRERNTQPQNRDWENGSLQWVWNISKENLLPFNIDSSLIFKPDEVPFIDFSIYGIGEAARTALLEKMGTNTRLLISPLGPSLWDIVELRDWLYLGETRTLKDPESAQEGIELVAVSTDYAPKGMPSFWINELFKSSLRLEELRQRQMAYSGDRRVYSTLKSAIQGFSQKVQKNLSARAENANTFEFAWGSDLRWFGSSEMAPNVALSIARTLAVMNLIDKTYVYSNGRYRLIGDGSVLNLDTKLFLATYPEYFPLIAFLESYPIEIPASYRIGSLDQTIDFIPSMPFEYNSVKYRISSTVSNEGLKLNVIFEKGLPMHRKEPVIDLLRTIILSASREMDEILGRQNINRAPFYFNLLNQDWFELKAEELSNHEMALIHINLLKTLSNDI